MHFFQSYSLEEDISKIAFWENINIKSSSESSGLSEELFKPSIINNMSNNFFSIYLHYFKNIYG